MSDVAQIIVVSILAPSILATITWFFTSRTKAQEWARQDEVSDRAEAVAAKAEEAAQLLVDRQIQLDEKTEEVARIAEIQSGFVNSQLQKIHTLVNSDMTAARRDELIRTREVKKISERIIDIVKKAGHEPDPLDVSRVEAATTRISELEAILADRIAQQKLVDDQTEKEVVDVGNKP